MTEHQHQVMRDLEAFADLALDVVVGIYPAFAAPWLKIQRKQRRDRIRRAASARKARRGWR